jgi:hypothetical protein
VYFGLMKQGWQLLVGADFAQNSTRNQLQERQYTRGTNHLLRELVCVLNKGKVVEDYRIGISLGHVLCYKGSTY